MILQELTTVPDSAAVPRDGNRAAIPVTD
jgi:hypothetical protein